MIDNEGQANYPVKFSYFIQWISKYFKSVIKIFTKYNFLASQSSKVSRFSRNMAMILLHVWVFPEDILQNIKPMKNMFKNICVLNRLIK